MKEDPMPTVLVQGPGIDGPYQVVKQHEDGSLLLHPVPQRSVADMLDEHGLRPMSAEEFERTFAHLPSDSAG
jgi:hypothetical protein